MTDEEIRLIIKKRRKAKRRRRRLVTLLVLLIAVIIAGCTLIKKAHKEASYRVKTIEDVYEADIASIRDAITGERITCRELTEYYLNRIDEYNDEYNCFITMCDDALEQADAKDALVAEGNTEGLLFGIPVVVKDNMDIAGYETTNGHSKGTMGTADANSYVVSRLLEEGAVIIGKTNMSTEAEAAGNSYSLAIGATHNAYNKAYSPGGSSGGTAAAVSLNFCVAGLGTDTNSSLRIPAAFNGDVALRSTFGLVDKTGIVPLNNSRDVAGPITRSVEDNAIMMDVLTGGVNGYSENLTDDALMGARIGVISELTGEHPVSAGGMTVNSEAYAAWENALEELEFAGAELVEVDLPAAEYSNRCGLGGTQATKDEYYSVFCSVMEENNIDAMIYPECLSDAIPVEITAESDMISGCYFISPIIGVPDISVPVGQMSTGVGVSMSIVAERGQEQTVLNLAHSYMSKFNHRGECEIGR